MAPLIIGGGYKKPRWSSSGAAMDPALWSTLPDDVLDRILAWLPIDALFRMRTLCRRWFKLTSSRCFKDLCSSVPLLQSAFVSTVGCGCGCQQRVLRTLLSTSSSSPGRWVRIPLNFLHHSATGVAVASSNGLVVISNIGSSGWDEQQSSSPLVVCNPLTRTWRELPPMLLHHRPAVLAMASTTTNSYKIVAAGRWTTEVYDSVLGCWHRCGCLPRGEEASRNVVVVGGVLYCLTPRWYNCSLLAFSLEQETWLKVKTGRLPGYCQFRNLVNCGGRVAIVGKCVRHQVFTVCLWLLEEPSTQSNQQQQQQQSYRKWREAGRMPRSMAEHFLVTPSEGFHCAAMAGLVLLTRDNSHDGVLFDMASQTWSWVPGCPGRETIGFEPRLDTTP